VFLATPSVSASCFWVRPRRSRCLRSSRPIKLSQGYLWEHEPVKVTMDAGLAVGATPITAPSRCTVS
jgi:hypothetical protein